MPRPFDHPAPEGTFCAGPYSPPQSPGCPSVGSPQVSPSPVSLTPPPPRPGITPIPPALPPPPEGDIATRISLSAAILSFVPAVVNVTPAVFSGSGPNGVPC